MNISINISANVVAWYAAIVSTIVMVIAILNYLGDKRRLKVSAQHGFLTGVSDDSTKVIITAANIGKRPITVSGVGFEMNEGGNLILMETPMLKLPHTLKEGTSCQTWINHDELMGGIKGDVKRIKSVWYRDSTGKYYKAKYKLQW